MTLSIAEVEKTAALARIRLTEGEKELFAHQLARVLDYVRELAALDLAPEPPPSALAGRERDDTPSGSLARDRALAATAMTRDGFVVVPRVLAEDDS